ncbi:PREDICTED: uncharacterized protein LOC108371223 [Rhagoletis zephyria]|uniref:uncharacterized protein LOC108371223 n=1 Tax=Rhagoletis zephyria TaxID=28612 RepID=UPI0008112127|nr:PREDICTED: uncharacterized protein LOC108371223 [Rhagoletis zephyria]
MCIFKTTFAMEALIILCILVYLIKKFFEGLFDDGDDDHTIDRVDSYDKCINAVSKLRRHCYNEPKLYLRSGRMPNSNEQLLEIRTHRGYCAVFNLSAIRIWPKSFLDLLQDRSLTRFTSNPYTNKVLRQFGVPSRELNRRIII